jgi:GT2 family glycosyltransferase
MKLSVIIVNYNVRYFFEQCLVSVFAALQGVDGEVWVVDNASTDGSVEMVRIKFPKVRLIANKKNIGFSKANNQAIRQAQGKYILLLNPDTVVQEDTFRQCINFMETHTEAGGLTVKMIDGKGHFLPESKRGFPSLWASFCKIFGLTTLFPNSKVFARYYLGHLDKNSTNAIEILPGAFMFLRAKTLQATGLLDEQFFMYGEDIDLSYRILQHGFKNYYLPDSQIIHYKGESTKKGSLNYVIVFYKAMILFAQKHFSKQKQKHFVALIKLAVFVRATASILKRIFIRMWLPLSDLAAMALGFT